MPTASEVSAYRATLTGVAGAAVADALRALAVADYTGDAETFTARALDVVPGLVALYGDAAAGYAADMYEQWRAEAGVVGRFRATPAAVAEYDQVAAGVRTAVGSLWRADPDVDAALTRLGGSMTRHVLSAATATVIENTARDPQAVGWRRIARRGACAFCRMLSGRGFTYKRATVSFRSHDSCRCVSSPEWDPSAEEVPAVVYVASKRKPSALDRVRVKDYLDAHYPQ